MPYADFLSVIEGITSQRLDLVEAIASAHRFSRAGRPDLAVQTYKVWASFNPNHPQLYAAHFNRGVLHSDLGDLAAAEEALRVALAANPDFPPIYINLGGVLERKGDPAQAVQVWQAGVARLAPVTGEAMNYKVMTLKQISRVLIDKQRQEEAEGALRLCLEHDEGQRDAAGQYVPLRLSQCKWPILSPTETVSRAALMRGIQPLSMAAYTDNPLLTLGSAWLYIKDDIDHGAPERSTDRRNAPIDLTGRRIRIGYVSSDLRDHAIGYLMAELFELHDRSQVEVFAYYCGIPSVSPLTKRTQAAVEHWVDIRDMDDDTAARRIAEDGIDILVDVNGLTKDARTAVFARRPAPIQVNWLGFPGSMGSPYHQYIIADDWIIPPSHEMYYSEKVVRLDCYQSNDRKRAVADPRPSRADAGLPEDAFVFCCFNGAQKITRFTFDRWMAILNRTPGSVLWLLTSTPETDERLRDHAEARGVARERIVFAPKLANAHHLARYPLADLFLDTAPYGAHTTASDALWMGVPVLTFSGRSFASRVCGSLVRSAGTPELVSPTPEAYVEQAVALAHDPAQLAVYRNRLSAGRDTCVLFDMDRLTAKLQDLYREMAAAHQQGLTPRPDLRNIEHYFDAGMAFDADAEELTGAGGYHSEFRAHLRARHLRRPIEPDARLWTLDAIVEAEAFVAADATPAAPPPAAPVEMAPADVHPLLQLRDCYDQASEILCEPLTVEAEKEVEARLARARALHVQVPDGTEFAGWEKHYRLALEAVDLSPLRRAHTTPLESFAAVVSSTGEPMDLEAAKALVKRVEAKAVFFVAADPTYIETYARTYVTSVLQNTDVASVVLMHVIGGAGCLAEIARSVGVEDERLIFTGDDFDPSTVATRCFDTPPKGLIERPVAHYQSVRFLKLGAVLRAFELPVFVSDIDLMLQRGVEDLLADNKGADLVLNKNEVSANAGSRFTANLLLVNPTIRGLIFTDFLAGYLREKLAGEEVSRWIDQFGLSMAYQYISRAGAKAKIKYFDTDRDINNVMYRSYEENPFRFLSLYHGFDMSSLESRVDGPHARVAAE